MTDYQIKQIYSIKVIIVLIKTHEKMCKRNSCPSKRLSDSSWWTSTYYWIICMIYCTGTVNMSLYYNNFCVMIAFFGINFFI